MKTCLFTHHRYGDFICVIVLSAALLASLAADALQLEGELQQGSVLIGRLGEGERITVDGQRLPITTEGEFVFGLDRDAGKTLSLQLT
ncbi:MAG: hypothetical protein ACR2PS_11450, partial [Pseudomonadales bacterium]